MVRIELLLADIAIRRKIFRALRDLIEGTCVWRIWYVLGVSELRQKYRRSTLGPFWATLALGMQAFVMGFLLSFLFHTDINRQLPYLCIGLVTWTFLSAALTEGANCFIGQSGVILQVKRPLWTYIMLVLWRNAIIYAHTFVVFVVAAIAFGIFPSTKYFLAPVGLALLVINAGWMALAAGLLSARFRDVPLLIQNLLTILVWLTPVYYPVEMLGPRTRMFIEFNPLTSIIEVARAPFLNEIPPLSVWLAALGIALLGWTLTFVLFTRTRARVPYWV